MDTKNKELTEEELQREALRASCSLCVGNGYCVCGELDPIEEPESEPMTDYEIFMEEDDI